MIYKLSHTKQLVPNQKIIITGSKSESNRLLLLQALYPEITIKNLSFSDDTQVMMKALQTSSRLIDIGHAGTAMRFLTPYFAAKKNSLVTLTGSDRMKERPIKVLVDALKKLGAIISYKEKEGYPPLEIEGALLKGGEVTIPATISSQYISGLLLIGASLEKGIQLELEGKITSRPYIDMTLSLLKKIGIQNTFKNQIIYIKPQQTIIPANITVESDWSAASYFYSLVALSNNNSITLGAFFEHSLQGDTAVVSIYKKLGVHTVFNTDGTITISKNETSEFLLSNEVLALDLNTTPDIAQTIAVTCFGLGIGCDLYGLHTLKIKETDRLEALKEELSKLGASISVTNESLHLKPSATIFKNKVIATYKDHRMAMAFAPLALKTSLQIEDPLVVSKSFPEFWEALKTLGVRVD